MGQDQSCSVASCTKCCSVKDTDLIASPRGLKEDGSDDNITGLRLPSATKTEQASEALQGNAKAAPDGESNSFSLQLHGAHLSRSFAKIGWMDPYAVVMVDDKEVGRTKPDKWAHKDPKWDCSYTWKSKGVPQAIQVCIMDKNRLHRDVVCGSVTVPCAADMGCLEQRDFTLTKRDKPTGTVCLTLHVLTGGSTKAKEVETDVTVVGGMEIDDMVSWSHKRLDGTMSLQLHEPHDEPVDLADADDAGSSEAVSKDETPQPVKQAGGSVAPALLGSWKCVSTVGLDEFLKATGVGMFQRKLAKAAKWPGWEFSMQGDLLVFINHSAIGDLKEEFPLGKEYTWKDGHGNLMTCAAEWRATPEGGVLTTSRSGCIGTYTEERCVTGNQLKFTLTHGTGVAWGRVFERVT